ncbi:UNVERIFIED_CONTAM: hypothetical protein Cloal_3108 [Acetivibrio alkalicellulosi]
MLDLINIRRKKDCLIAKFPALGMNTVPGIIAGANAISQGITPAIMETLNS